MIKNALIFFVLLNMWGCIFNFARQNPCDSAIYDVNGVAFINKYGTNLNICVSYGNKNECIGYIESDGIFKMTINNCSYANIPHNKKIVMHFFESETCYLFSHTIESQDVNAVFLISEYGIYPKETEGIPTTTQYQYRGVKQSLYNENPRIKTYCKIYPDGVDFKGFPDQNVMKSYYIDTAAGYTFGYSVEEK